VATAKGYVAMRAATRETMISIMAGLAWSWRLVVLWALGFYVARVKPVRIFWYSEGFR
jgi:hypothetical protein